MLSAYRKTINGVRRELGPDFTVELEGRGGTKHAKLVIEGRGVRMRFPIGHKPAFGHESVVSWVRQKATRRLKRVENGS